MHAVIPSTSPMHEPSQLQCRLCWASATSALHLAFLRSPVHQSVIPGVIQRRSCDQCPWDNRFQMGVWVRRYWWWVFWDKFQYRWGTRLIDYYTGCNPQALLYLLPLLKPMKWNDGHLLETHIWPKPRGRIFITTASDIISMKWTRVVVQGNVCKNAGHQSYFFQGISILSMRSRRCKHKQVNDFRPGKTSVGRFPRKKEWIKFIYSNYWWSLKCPLTQDSLWILFCFLQSHIAVWFRRISILGFQFFYNKISVSLPDQMKNVLTDDLSPNPWTFLIPDCPPHKCATAVCPKCVFPHETSYIKVISFEWTWWKRKLRVRVFMGEQQEHISMVRRPARGMWRQIRRMWGRGKQTCFCSGKYDVWPITNVLSRYTTHKRKINKHTVTNEGTS